MSTRFFTITFAIALAAMPAFSATTTYTSRSLWQTDVSSFESVTFEDTDLGFGATGVIFYDGTTTTQIGSCPSVAAEQACFQNAGGASFEWIVGTGDGPAPSGHRHFRLNDASGFIQISMGPGTQNFGMDFYTVSLDNRPISVTLFADSAGTTVLGSYTGINPSFFGVVSDDSIAMIRLSSGNFSEIYLDQFDFAGDSGSGGGGGPAETPEATSFAYMGLGMAALWFGSRKRLPAAIG